MKDLVVAAVIVAGFLAAVAIERWLDTHPPTSRKDDSG